MALPVGTRFGPYEVVAPLGVGGMGEVYRARDTKLKRDVAVKVLPEAVARDPERMARFQREAEVLASLNHANIATILGVEGGALVMELVEGESPKGPMPPDDAWKIAAQIAAALEYAHERGIVHRDLKPANIKVTPDGGVKLLDFGLAKAFSNRADGSSTGGVSDSPSHSPTLTVHATEVGLILGTAAYMSPEQARGKKVDKRADIWSFGVVLYELLTGERLFQGEDITETLASVVKDQPDLSRVPMKARQLLERCLEKDPRKRLRDIGDAALLWEGAPAAPQEVAVSSSRSARLAWAAAALFLASTAALSVVHFREKPPAHGAPVRFEGAAPENGAISFLALSPDGSKLAMSVQGADGRGTAWIRSLDSVEARKLAGTEGSIGSLAWSPDSRYLAFGEQGKLKKIDVSGGAPETLCAYTGGLYGIAWSPRDVILFASGNSFSRVSAAGGEVAPVTQIDSNHGDSGQGWPVFLPDGQHFLYYLLAGPASNGLYAGSIDAKPAEQDRRRLTESESGPLYALAPGGGPGYVLFVRGDTLMARRFDAVRRQFTGDAARVADSVGTNGAFAPLASNSDNGILATSSGGSANRQLTWYDRQGKVLSHPGEPGGRDELNLSPDGTQVAEGRIDAQGLWVVWLLDLARNVSSRFTFDANGAGNAVWSPDGKQIVYAAGGGRSFDISRKPSNGATKEEVLFHSDSVKTPLDWSTDGRWLLYMEHSKETHADLWVLPDASGPAGTPRKPVPYLATPFNEQQAKFSPDGKWIVYTSNESGGNEVYVRPFPASSGGKWLVSNGGGSQARWRRDGKELFYFRSDGTLMAVEAQTSPTFQAGVPKALFRARILGGAGGAPNVAWRWDISKDGQRFLVNTAAEDKNATPVTVTTQWMEMLRGKP